MAAVNDPGAGYEHRARDLGQSQAQMRLEQPEPAEVRAL